MILRILIVEDDELLSSGLASEFKDHGYEVSTARETADIPQHFIFDFAVVDLRLSQGESGLNVVSHIKKKSPTTKIVVMTGYGSISTAIEAIKLGAEQYLTKPVSYQKIVDAFTGERNATHTNSRPSLSDIEHEYIEYVLAQNKGNVTQTAKELGLHRQSLQRKLKKYT